MRNEKKQCVVMIFKNTRDCLDGGELPGTNRAEAPVEGSS